MLAGGLVIGGGGKGYTLTAMGRYGHFSAVEGLPTGSALLVVKRGPNAGARFLLDRPITSAGRHSSSDIILDDVTVSGRHAEFRWENDELHVVDVAEFENLQSCRDAAKIDNLVPVLGAPTTQVRTSW